MDQDLESIWSELLTGIEDVYAHRGMSTSRFMQRYSSVYNFCVKTTTERTEITPEAIAARCRGRKAHGKPPKADPINPADKYDSTLNKNIGLSLYNRIEEFLHAHLAKVVKDGLEKMGEASLIFYQSQWIDYNFSCRAMNGLCAYLNRHWLRPEIGDGKDHIHHVYQLCLDVWKYTVFDKVHLNTTPALLGHIEKDRNGEKVNEGRLRDIIGSYVSLGDDGLPVKGSLLRLGIYQRKFEKDFLAQTEIYYKKEAAEYINSDDLNKYLEKVERRLVEEEERVNSYLHISTLPALKLVCDKILVGTHLEQIRSEFPTLLKEDKQVEIARITKLLSRLDNAFGDMKDVLEEHIAVEGEYHIRLNGKQCLADPKEYIKTIMSVYNKYNTLVKSTSGDSGFGAALDKACARFINTNFITEAGCNKSPEHLARYCDSLLKQTGRGSEDEEIEEALNEAMIVFKLMEDKDVFQKYYTLHLAHRLVLQSSTNEDAESSMISQFKQACGFEYITKLQRMHQDIKVSKTRNDNFKKWLVEEKKSVPLDIDMSVMVLSTGSWPFTQSHVFNLPVELETSLNMFTEYYNSLHNGRKLTWIYHSCKNEIVTTCYSQPYTFACWTSQAAILLLYNTKESYTMADLMEATDISEDVMKQLLSPFLRHRLLVMKGPVEELEPTSVLKLLKGFKNKKQRLNTCAPIRLESAKEEREKTVVFVEKDRKWECQAAIIRVMKMRKVLEHQLLISEVIGMVKARFKPKISLIKKSIDVLIEKEYLVRDESQKDTYKYI